MDNSLISTCSEALTPSSQYSGRTPVFPEHNADSRGPDTSCGADMKLKLVIEIVVDENTYSVQNARLKENRSV